MRLMMKAVGLFVALNSMIELEVAPRGGDTNRVSSGNRRLACALNDRGCCPLTRRKRSKWTNV